MSADASSVEVVREIDSGIETRKLNLPAIVTVDLRLNEPRYASLPNIMKARSKPLETIELSSLGIDTAPRIKVVSVEESGTKDRASKQISSAEELIYRIKSNGSSLMSALILIELNGSEVSANSQSCNYSCLSTLRHLMH